MSDDTDVEVDTSPMPEDGSHRVATKRDSEEAGGTEESEQTRPKKIVKLEERKVPNIALELAKNRTAAKGLSPSPRIHTSIPLTSLLSGEPNANGEESIAKAGSSEPDIRQSILANTTRLKVSSLLSSDVSTQHDRNTAPKIILPTQTTVKSLPDPDGPGFLIARTNSPVTFLPKTFTTTLNRSQSALNPSLTPVSPSIAERTISLPVPSDEAAPLPALKSVPKSRAAKTIVKPTARKQATKKKTNPIAETSSGDTEKTESASTMQKSSPEPKKVVDVKKVVRQRRTTKSKDTKEVDPNPQPVKVIIEDMQKVGNSQGPAERESEAESSNQVHLVNVDNDVKPLDPEKGVLATTAKKSTKTAVAKKDGKSSDLKKTTKTADSKKEKKVQAAKPDSQLDSKKPRREADVKKTSKASVVKKESQSVEASVKPGDSKKDSSSTILKQDSKVNGTKTASKAVDSKKEASAVENSKESKSKDGKTNTKDEAKKDTKAKRSNTSSKKKDPTPQPSKKVIESKGPQGSPKKLIPVSPLKSPTILDGLDKGKSTDEHEDPVILIDVPLYPTDSKNYLNENGQVVLNFYKMVQDKFGQPSKIKRNLISELHGGEEDDDDAAEVEDDDGVDEDEDDDVDLDDKPGSSAAPIASPKKKSHPMKGRSLIGKYDTEDPFIDDSELLWEEQRVATKDGFFVYFGPLIEKGQYASFERVNGTMKRGGIKYSK
ncbi:LANO_0F02740g1_1 [Lachancea nothofagi CBS 11611]|uniref:LANO_0F02740g1_1 n=1 Tax=Lachancea nothofagi CBS 11611 TaxID=1266666 RepID=A0A1G4K6U2_9SACH|nr:LANO_0F02740g1_1 [Lachancea nothofagi CBS 11611]